MEVEADQVGVTGVEKEKLGEFQGTRWRVELQTKKRRLGRSTARPEVVV